MAAAAIPRAFSGGTTVSAIELPGGVTIRTFAPPPDGFNPVKADARALLAHGYPSRPEDPAMLERWERVLSRPIQLIQPVFRSMPYKRRRLPQVTAQVTHGTESTDIWSGAVVHAPAGDSFKWIEGEWTVPNAFPPSGAADGVWYSASTWIGIDGIDGSGDVLQAGCDSDVMTSGGTIQRQLNPWWEWYPAGSFWISNLPVAQGDTMDGLICVNTDPTIQPPSTCSTSPAGSAHRSKRRHRREQRWPGTPRNGWSNGWRSTRTRPS